MSDEDFDQYEREAWEHWEEEAWEQWEKWLRQKESREEEIRG